MSAAPPRRSGRRSSLTPILALALVGVLTAPAHVAATEPIWALLKGGGQVVR